MARPVPILDLSFDPAMPVDTGIHTTAIGFEYDPVTYAPRYWGNPLALLNALAAFETVHGYYLSPNGNEHDCDAALRLHPGDARPPAELRYQPGQLPLRQLRQHLRHGSRDLAADWRT